MVQKQSWQARKALAEQSDCSVEVLGKFAKDRSWRVRQAVAQNPNCPVDVLASLASDCRAEVREAVANNPQCPAEIALAALAQDDNWIIRLGVAVDVQCPPETLVLLAMDDNPRVRQSALQHPQLPVAEVLKTGSLEVIKELLGKRQLSLAELQVGGQGGCQ